MPPQPPRLPAVPRLRALMDSRQLAGHAAEVFRTYTASLGDTFLFRFGGFKTAIVSSDPAVLQHVLKTNHENYQKSEFQTARIQHFLGPGLLILHGQPWHRQRRLIHQGGFRAVKLVSMASAMHECLDGSLAQFDGAIQDGPVDIYPEMMRMTFRMVSRLLFSASLPDGDIDRISHAISTIQEFMVRQIIHPYLNPWFIMSGALRKHEAMRDRCAEIVLDLIQRRRRHPGPHDDLLGVLMDAVSDETGEPMSDEAILHECLHLLVAGHETSSNALCWTLYLLSKHPEYVEAVRSEYDRVVGDSVLQYADLPGLDVTTQIIEESLRLYPPFWMVDRVAVADDDIMGIRIPKGTIVVAFIYGAHRSPKLWDDPDRFIPERFSKAHRVTHTPFAYLPFGGGPRGCVGGTFAMLQMLMIVGGLLRRYDFELAPDQDVSPRSMVFLRPNHGIRMAFAKRRIRT